MKYKTCYEVIAENYEEEQFLLSRFPESIWFITEKHVKFFIPKQDKQKIIESIGEWKEQKKK